MSTTATLPREPRRLTPEEYYTNLTGPELWRRRVKEPAPPVASPDPGTEPVRVFSTGSFEEPEWPDTFRGNVARLIWQRGAALLESGKTTEGKRLQKKAYRFLTCNKCARPGRCSREPFDHKWFVPNGCEVVFCRECADQVRRELFASYLQVIRDVLGELGGIPPGWVLARATVTLRSTGEEITPEQVKEFNSAVRFLARKMLGRRYGFLYSDETGFETRGHLPDHLRQAHGLNLHAHGLFLGPYVEWEKWRDEWARITRRRFGQPSTGIYLTRVKVKNGDLDSAVRWALNHLLKYVSKPPAVSPERLASLIAAFHGTKRVHALGLFAGRKQRPKKHDIPCPKCRAEGLPGVICFEGRELPGGGQIPLICRVETLVAQGYWPLRGFQAFDEAARFIVEGRFPTVSSGEGPP